VRHASRIATCLCVLLVAAPSLMWGQATATGTITGTITSQIGGMIAGAEVAIMDVATKATQAQPANQVVHFIFSNLDPEIYGVSVTKAGFRRLRVPAQTVRVGNAIILTLPLAVEASKF